MTWDEYIAEEWNVGKKEGKKDDGSFAWVIDFNDPERASEVKDQAIAMGAVNARLREPEHPMNRSGLWWEVYPGEGENNTGLLD